MSSVRRETTSKEQQCLAFVAYDSLIGMEYFEESGALIALLCIVDILFFKTKFDRAVAAAQRMPSPTSSFSHASMPIKRTIAGQQKKRNNGCNRVATVVSIFTRACNLYIVLNLYVVVLRKLD